MTSALLEAFRAELEKESGIGTKLWEGVRGVGRVLNPATAGGEIRAGWQAASNVSPEARAALGHELSGVAERQVTQRAAEFAQKHKGGILEGFAERRLQAARAQEAKVLGELPRYKPVAEENAPGALGHLRRGGWLSNVGKYQGTDPWRRAMNVAGRALPGQKSLAVAGTGLQVAGDTSGADPATGARRGLAERALGTGAGVAGGIASLKHVHGGGFIVPVVTSLGAGMAGKMIGRGIDRAVGK